MRLRQHASRCAFSASKLSNAGTGTFFKTDQIGFDKGASGDVKARMESAKHTALEEFKKSFRPELLARIDKTVVFDALGADAITKIVRLELSSLKKRLAKRGTTLAIPTTVITFLAKKSLVPEHGARLVRKNIEELVEKAIAKTLLAGTGTKHRLALSLSDETIVCTESKNPSIKK